MVADPTPILEWFWSGSCVACESLNISGMVVQCIQITAALTILPFAKIPAQKSLLCDMNFAVHNEGNGESAVPTVWRRGGRGDDRDRGLSSGRKAVPIVPYLFDTIHQRFDVRQFWLLLAQLFSAQQ